MARSPAASVGSQATFKQSSIRVLKCLRPPDEWTKVKEVYMENRAPCEVTRSPAH